MRKIDPAIFLVNDKGYKQNPEYGPACAEITLAALEQPCFGSFSELSRFIENEMKARVTRLTHFSAEGVFKALYALEAQEYRNGDMLSERTTSFRDHFRPAYNAFRDDLEGSAFSKSPHLHKINNGYRFKYICRDDEKINLSKILRHILKAPTDKINKLRQEIDLLYTICMDESQSVEERKSAMVDLYYLQCHYWRYERGSATHARLCMQFVAETIGCKIPCTEAGVNLNLCALLTPHDVFKQRFASGAYFEKAKGSVKEACWVDLSSRGVSDNAVVR